MNDFHIGPWRIDHCIQDIDGATMGRVKFRCRVQPLQTWTLQIDNVHTYINRRQASHIVSVATALEVGMVESMFYFLMCS